MTRLLVCGGRDWTDRETLFAGLDEVAADHEIVAVIEGEAPGADTMAREWAEARGITVERYPADWKGLGKAAGSIRNSQMLQEGRPDFVVAFPTPASRGTWDMVRKAKDAGVLTVVLS